MDDDFISNVDHELLLALVFLQEQPNDALTVNNFQKRLCSALRIPMAKLLFDGLNGSIVDTWRDLKLIKLINNDNDDAITYISLSDFGMSIVKSILKGNKCKCGESDINVLLYYKNKLMCSNCFLRTTSMFK